MREMFLKETINRVLFVSATLIIAVMAFIIGASQNRYRGPQNVRFTIIDDSVASTDTAGQAQGSMDDLVTIEDNMVFTNVVMEN